MFDRPQPGTDFLTQKGQTTKVTSVASGGNDVIGRNRPIHAVLIPEGEMHASSGDFGGLQLTTDKSWDLREPRLHGPPGGWSQHPLHLAQPQPFREIMKQQWRVGIEPMSPAGANSGHRMADPLAQRARQLHPRFDPDGWPPRDKAYIRSSLMKQD